MQPEGPIASVSVPGGVPNPITTTTTTVTRSSGSSSSGSTMSQHHPTSSSSQQQPANQQQPQQPQQQPQAAAKPLFTMEQLQAMQRQMMAASAVPMQPPLPLQPPSSSTAATQPQQQQQPYMVLTQLPLAATPFFNYAQAALPQMMQLPQQPPQQQPQPNTSSSQSLPQQQQPLPATSSSSQSLPLPPLNSGLRGQTHHQQQQQQQHTPNNATVPQTSNNNNNKNSTTAANTTATATSTTTTANPLPAAWAHWMNPTPLRQGFSPTVTTGTPMTAPAQTQHLLQQLLYNAAAAQQTQQQQQPSQSNGSHAPATTTTTTTTNAAVLPSPPALVPNAMQQNRAQNEQNAQRVQQQQQQSQQQQQQQSIPLVAHHHYQPRSQQQQQQQQQSQTTTNTTALMTLGSQFLQSRVQPVAQKDDSSHHNNVYSESWKTMFDDDNTNHNSNNDSSSNPCDTTANASSSVPTTDGASRQGQKRSLSMTTEDWAPTPWAEMNATSNHTNDTTTTTAAPAHTNTTNDTSAPTQDTAAQNFSNQLRQLQLFQQQHQQQQQQQIIQQQVQLQQQQRIQSQPATPKETMALPSTVMPPSLLTSMLPAQASGSPKLTSAATASNSKRMKPTLQSVSAEGVSSPQQVLERLLTLRGYTFRRVSAEESAYDTVPSALQLASFGTALVKAVHMEDVPRLSRLLGTGLSANPCNQFRDSIVDLVCKRASADIFTCLVEHGCDLRVCDGFGRTPLHHCCWASTVSPSICRTIVQADAQQLFMEDKRGQTPLEYVRPNQAAAWIEFLKTSVAELFPSGGSLPPVVSLKDVRVDGKLPDPPHSLSVALASAISSGELTPEKLEEMDPAVRAQR